MSTVSKQSYKNTAASCQYVTGENDNSFNDVIGRQSEKIRPRFTCVYADFDGFVIFVFAVVLQVSRPTHTERDSAMRRDFLVLNLLFVKFY